jgi:uroporphyrinogen decarboxylase
MNHHERLNALLQGEPVDRLPVYFFGTWAETKLLWRAEGCPGIVEPFGDAGPQLPDMDPDWEDGMWSCHGLANTDLIGDREPQVVERGDGWVLRRDRVGALLRESTIGASIPEIVEPALSPNRASWSRFRKFLDPADPRRRPPDWARLGAEVARRDRLLAFMGGSLFGWLRNWMGLEAISFLQYDDPLLLEEMIDHLVDLFMELLGPVCSAVPFDLVHFFEDCCGAAGPLFSPAFYDRVLAPRYARLLDFYRSRGVRWSLLDSDGNVEALAPCWIESGFDILFPLEAGKWGTTPTTLRSKLGPQVRIMGAVNKNVLSEGAESVRAHLESLRSEVDRGGFLPLPDHRIPPTVSYEQFRGYLRIFGEVFAR